MVPSRVIAPMLLQQLPASINTFQLWRVRPAYVVPVCSSDLRKLGGGLFHRAVAPLRLSPRQQFVSGMLLAGLCSILINTFAVVFAFILVSLNVLERYEY